MKYDPDMTEEIVAQDYDMAIATLVSSLFFIWFLYFFGFEELYTFQEHRGRPGPYPKTDCLVTCGPFAFVRNLLTLYLGVSFVIRIWYARLVNLAIYVGYFFIILTAWFKYFEEPELLRRFGQDYKTYCEHVPRWKPRLTAYRKN